MNESRKKSFLDAVDIVCGECIDLSEETCDGCPVRRTVESIDIDPIYGRPMTAEQLRNMDGQPVKVKDLAYVTHENLPTGVVTMNDPNDGDNGVYVGYSLHCIKDYGKDWLAYAYPPAHIDREALSCAGCDYLDRENVPCAHCLRAAGYADYYKPMDKPENG